MTERQRIINVLAVEASKRNPADLAKFCEEMADGMKWMGKKIDENGWKFPRLVSDVKRRIAETK